MRDIETILVEKYKLQRVAIDLNGPLCIVAQNHCMTGIVAAPGHYDTSGKWIIRFIPTIPWSIPGGYAYCCLGAMIEERFDSKDECITYLSTQESHIYKKLYIYALDVIKGKVGSLDELENMDPTNRGQFLDII